MFFFICRFLEIKICLKVKRNFLKHILKPKKQKTKQNKRKKNRFYYYYYYYYYYLISLSHFFTIYYYLLLQLGQLGRVDPVTNRPDRVEKLVDLVGFTRPGQLKTNPQKKPKPKHIKSGKNTKT